MAQMLENPSRPTNIDDFIQRLTNDGTSQEKTALRIISKKMIVLFIKESRDREFASDIAKLSSITVGKDYRDILRAFGNAISKGTADGENIDPTILWHFLYVIRRADENRSTKDTGLGSILQSLEKRLRDAKEQADLESQYRLIRTLSAVLDAMLDIGVSGLSRENVHEPLLKKLKEFSKHKEPRLAQAAGYAYQALLSIPNDETAGEAALRHFCQIGNGVFKAAGAVSTMDPGKLMDALPTLAVIPDLISDLKDAFEGLKMVYDGGQGAPKAKKWYFDLRYTAAFIGLEDFKELRNFAKSCREEEFQRGLYAQLEVQALANQKEGVRQQCVSLIHELLVDSGSNNQRVQVWRDLVAKTLDQPGWCQVVKSRYSFWRIGRRSKVYCLRDPFLEEPNLTSSSSLLEKAWLECDEARRYYAVAAISEYYSGSGRLTIQRISGDTLPMKRCYINLAIVERSKNETTKKQTSPFSLFARLGVDEVEKASQVALPMLFSQRKRADGTLITPKRILIQGDAGVGKTTLCKKIVHDYLHKNMWQQSFDCLLWIPLRRLKGKSEGACNLRNLFHDIYFSKHLEGKLLAETLWKSIDDQSNSFKILFLLDGLDEVSHELSSQSSIRQFLEQLLQQPNVIITSRPYRLNRDSLGHLDLELHTTGFNPDQVAAYINTTEIVNDPETARQIQLFIKSHPLIQGLVRIPIQLDALCYSWNEGLFLKNIPKTMTTTYESIARKLWQKDMLSLEKEDQGKRLIESTVRSLNTQSQIERVMGKEIDLLEGLAFIGLYNNIVEFNAEHRGQIYEYLNTKIADLPLSDEDTFKNLSFLRTSDSALQDREQVYHFLHLTFQEFFAAKYFAKCWAKDEELSYLILGGLESQTISPQEFLRREKYNSRYNILWRFVAGLLQDRGGKGLLSFLQVLESKPRDIMGPSHQRLVINCLCEVALSDLDSGAGNFKRFQGVIDTQLLLWLSYEFNLELYPITIALGCQSEFPEHVLQKFLQNCKKHEEKKKMHAFEVIRGRPMASSEILSTSSLCLFGTCSSNELRDALMQTLASHHQSCSEDLVSYLEGDGADKRMVAKALQSQSNLPQNIIDALVPCLKDGELGIASIGYDAAETLYSQSSLPLDTLNTLALYLQDKDQVVRKNAAKAFSSHSHLPQDVLDAIVLCFQDNDSDIRYSAMFALHRETSLSQDNLNAVVLCLQDENSQVSYDAAQVLSRQSHLPQDILNAIVSCFQNEDSDVRCNAAVALHRESSLPRDILDAIVLCFQDKDSNVRYKAVQALESQPNLPQDVLNALVLCLQDTGKGVSIAVGRVLEHQSSLPRDILDAIVLCSQDNDSDIRYNAVVALNIKSNLPQDILHAIFLRLQDEELNVRHRAATALGNNSSLPQDILEALIFCLQNDEAYVRLEAARGLDSQSSLPQDILKSLVLCLLDKDYEVRRIVVSALGKQTLPQDIVNAIALYLQEEDLYIRHDVAIALSSQTGLNPDILNALVLCLQDKESLVRYGAITALGNQSNLPQDIIIRLASLLDGLVVEVDHVVENLRKHQHFYSILPTLEIPQLKGLYKCWVKRSFYEQISCYMRANRLVIDMPEGIREVLFNNSQKDRFNKAIREAKVELRMPPGLKEFDTAFGV